MRNALALAVAVLSGCAHAPSGPPRAEDVAIGGAHFRLEYLADDAAAARDVARALAEAVARVARWGGLAAEVTVRIQPSHAALERAVGREGYPWLRAWARYRSIDLQSPSSWGPFDGGRARLAELVAHELAHCAMYQRAGDDGTWMYKEIPRWFTEGLASVTAGQERRHGGLGRLYRDYGRALAADAPAGDPLDPSEALYQGRSEEVYRAAHHAFAFLLARYGEARIRAILDRMSRGERFPAAFRGAIGIGDAEFAADFRRYVVWQGWR
ncbi:MAG TPA: hypothetical protein VM753_04470 [Anaeromyxobacter sp.]|nr:hypothetical protein [Anaeromyxobacter sp.]